MTLRQRLILTLAPSLLILAALGATGLVLLVRVSNRIDLILRENYDSVVAMVGLNEALERIDSSYTLAILGRQEQARASYISHWQDYDKHLEVESRNITILPREQELFDELVALTRQYRADGDHFFGLDAGQRAGKGEKPHLSREERERLYEEGRDGRPGLLAQFEAIKKVIEETRLLNQENMQEANVDAQRTARVAIWGFAGGLALAGLLAGLLAWSTDRAMLQPIRDLTGMAQRIGAGNLETIVPVVSHDEIGELGEAFNRMSYQLRAYRQTHVARLLRVQRTSQATIDSFLDPVLVVDPDGRVDMANPAARSLLGLTPPPADAVMSATSPPGPIWQPPPPLVEPLREALQRNRPFLTQAFDQTVSFRLCGEDRTYLPQILPIRDPFGNTLGAAVVLNDVTRFRLLDQIKSDLVATVSHELKTPLTGVRLVLHLLLEETVGPLTPKQTELLLDARENAERLLEMIEHLLALARLEEGREHLECVTVTPISLLREAADVASPRAESGQVELVVDANEDLPQVNVDPNRLGHALNNLLDNALTYTPPGGRITLSAAAEGTDRVRLTVADTGTGIPPEHMGHLFERFFRVPGQSRGQGTGLGLALVREIMTAHGGTVTCTSEPGQGTTFHLLLPACGEAGSTVPPVTAMQ
jgi:signal transduction histidine kinase